MWPRVKSESSQKVHTSRGGTKTIHVGFFLSVVPVCHQLLLCVVHKKTHIIFTKKTNKQCTNKPIHDWPLECTILLLGHTTCSTCKQTNKIPMTRMPTKGNVQPRRHDNVEEDEEDEIYDVQPFQLTGIVRPGAHDVCSGRGGQANNHCG